MSQTDKPAKPAGQLFKLLLLFSWKKNKQQPKDPHKKSESCFFFYLHQQPLRVCALDTLATAAAVWCWVKVNINFQFSFSLPVIEYCSVISAVAKSWKKWNDWFSPILKNTINSVKIRILGFVYKQSVFLCVAYHKKVLQVTIEFAFCFVLFFRERKIKKL